jgi:hypothetical protein
MGPLNPRPLREVQGGPAPGSPTAVGPREGGSSLSSFSLGPPSLDNRRGALGRKGIYSVHPLQNNGEDLEGGWVWAETNGGNMCDGGEFSEDEIGGAEVENAT